jgi:hypothetical protein
MLVQVTMDSGSTVRTGLVIGRVAGRLGPDPYPIRLQTCGGGVPTIDRSTIAW